MKLNLNFNLKSIDGKEINDSHAGKLLGNILVSSIKGDALKYYDWGRKLYNGEDIEIDRSDLNNIKSFVESHEQITILAKAQILEVINTAKE